MKLCKKKEEGKGKEADSKTGKKETVEEKQAEKKPQK